MAIYTGTAISFCVNSSLMLVWGFIIFTCMSVLPACMFMCHVGAGCLQKSERRVSDALGLRLQMVVSRPVGAGN